MCLGQGTHPPPLLLLQLVVADLLALQVQLGVLQLGCQPLGLLLQLLQGPLALVAVCLQVPELGCGRGAGSATGKRPGSGEGEEKEGGEGGRDPGMRDGVDLPLGICSPRG